MSDTIDLTSNPALTVDDDGFLYLDDEIVDENTTYKDVVYIQNRLQASDMAFNEIEIFCQLVEKGQIYSRTTYAKFLDILYLAGYRTEHREEVNE